MTTRSPVTALVLLISIAAAPATSRAGEGDDARATAQAFCAATMRTDDAAVRDMLSTSLGEMVAEAEQRNAIIAAEAPDEKPPFGDGIPYRSYPDRPDTCSPGDVRMRADAMEVDILYGFDSEKGAGWTDTLILSGEPPRIVDVRFRGAPDGSAPQTLRDVLTGAFDF
jgi:hypothetical protein